MSNWQQGPDWWRANDGRWYPPGWRPDRTWTDRPAKWTMRARAGLVAMVVIATGIGLVIFGGPQLGKRDGCAQFKVNDSGRLVCDGLGDPWAGVGVGLLAFGALIAIVAFILPSSG